MHAIELYFVCAFFVIWKGRCENISSSRGRRNMCLMKLILQTRVYRAQSTTESSRTLNTKENAFISWDTYGFPLDLTQLMAEERGLTVDVNGFNAAMEEARERSRNAQGKQAGGVIAMDANATAELHNKGVPTTNDSSKFIWFQV